MSKIYKQINKWIKNKKQKNNNKLNNTNNN